MKEYEQQEEKNENIASEPGVEYASAPTSHIPFHPACNPDVETQETEQLHIDEFFEKNKEAIEAACERVRQDQTKAPEGYYSLKEFDELFKKKLLEAYASL